MPSSETTTPAQFEARYRPGLNQTGAIAASNWPAATLHKFCILSLAISPPPTPTLDTRGGARQCRTSRQEQDKTSQDKPLETDAGDKTGQDARNRQPPYL